MNHPRLISTLLSLIMCGCVSTQQSHLTTYNSGGYQHDWDKLLISKVDGHGITPAKDAVALDAGKRTVTFSLNYMRGDLEQPILIDVPVTGFFARNTYYKAFVHYVRGFMGVTIQTGHTTTAGALVYSADFDAHGQEVQQRINAYRKREHVLHASVP